MVIALDSVVPFGRSIENTPDDWVWSYHRSPNYLHSNREKAI
ncbi:MAG: hypothetical protein AAF572_21020 [Cyanobacteria bacterium P01_B01_bin.77]